MVTRLGSHVKVMTALSGPTDVVERAQALRGAGASGVFTFEGHMTRSHHSSWPPRSAVWI
jgi:hypothetical protein